MGLTFLVVMGVFVLLTNMYASFRVFRDDCAERNQKIAQISLIWLLPALGALMVLAIYRTPDKPSGKYYRSASMGDDYGMVGSGINKVLEAVDGD